MGLKQIQLIKPKSVAKSIVSHTEIQSYINEMYKDVADKNRLKYLSSFILFICCVIEECYQKDKKIDKKNEVMKHIETFLGVQLKDQDRQIITDIIEDLHSSRRIKRVAFIQKALFTIGSFFLTR